MTWRAATRERMAERARTLAYMSIMLLNDEERGWQQKDQNFDKHLEVARQPNMMSRRSLIADWFEWLLPLIENFRAKGDDAPNI